MKINHNIPALRTLNQLNKANDKSSKAMERLSSGLRINSAADDAAGLAISQKMTTQVKGLGQANRNAMDGISMIQTAEGAYNEVHAMLQRMRELTVQAATGTYNADQKANMMEEVNQLKDEILSMQDRTEFNKKKLLNNSGGSFIFQVGANANQSLTILGADIDLNDVIADVSTVDFTNTAADLLNLDKAIADASDARGKLGAYQNRLEHIVSNLGVSEENITAALSRIQDADMAFEMANFTQTNILSQAATAMLAQANERPQQILQLLQR
jgi:flagellin